MNLLVLHLRLLTLPHNCSINSESLSLSHVLVKLLQLSPLSRSLRVFFKVALTPALQDVAQDARQALLESPSQAVTV